jgi:ABC-type Zn uptake system ZnuABC Zn-binding protein ZnuA
MPELAFQLYKTYEENLEAFKQHVTALDPTLAEILFKHLDKLLADNDPGNRANRTAFNRAVLAELEALPQPTEGAAP